MPIFFTISIVALLALLWATISIVQHVHRSRRRRRFFRESLSPSEEHPDHVAPEHPSLVFRITPSVELQPAAVALHPTSAAFSFASIGPLSPIATSSSLPAPAPTPASEPAGPSSAGRIVPAHPSSLGPLGLIAAARQISRDMPQPDPRSSGVRKAVQPAYTAPTPVPETLPPEIPATASIFIPQPFAEAPPSASLPAPQPIQAPAEQLPITANLPERKSPQPAQPLAAALAPLPPPDPLLRRPVRSVHPANSGFTLPSRRPDWIYFNKDMGDLSDPTPSRIRDRVRSR